MAQMDSESFAVWREIGRLDDRAVHEAAPCSEPGARVTLWPGSVPDLPPAVHPLLAAPVGQGTVGGDEVWIENENNRKRMTACQVQPPTT